jgi:hypothetical protein
VNPNSIRREILRSDRKDIVSMVAKMKMNFVTFKLRSVMLSSTSLAFVILAIGTNACHAQVKTYVKDGYQVTETTNKTIIQEVQYENQKQTVPVQKVETEYQPMVRTYQIPVTEWVAEPHVVNRWNPFATPYVQYQYVQRTRWETKQDTVQVPTLKTKWVNDERTVQVPKIVQKEREEIVTRSVALRDLPSVSNNTMLAKNPAGFGANGNNSGPLNQQTDPRAQEPRMAARPPQTLPNQPAGSVLNPNPQPNAPVFGGAANNNNNSFAPPASTLPNGGFGAPNTAPPANAQNLPQGYPR